jgi:hypothetical protein
MFMREYSYRDATSPHGHDDDGLICVVFFFYIWR